MLSDRFTYVSFYKTPIFSFIVNVATGIRRETPFPRTSQPPTINFNQATDVLYKQLRIRNPRSSNSSRFQITNIALYNGGELIPINTTELDPTNPSRNLSYLFDVNNLNRTNPNQVITYENNNNIDFTIIISTAGVSFNGISFVSGIDVNKCLDMWIVEASPNGTDWNIINIQDFPYINRRIKYPRFFCRTPIFDDYDSSTELNQPKFYDIQYWPITHVRFTPIYMYGENSSTEFEISHFEFFRNGQRLESFTSSTNNNLLIPYIYTSSIGNIQETRISDLTVFRGRYSDDVINFQFSSAQSFNAFSFMSGPDITKCVQLWRLEVSMNGSFWVTVHLTPDNEPYRNNNYPSPYYRLPIMFFFKDISIESNTEYYIISGTPTNTNNNGSLFKIRLMFSYIYEVPTVLFTTIIDGTIIKGAISSTDRYILENFIGWNALLNTPIGGIETVYFKNADYESYRTIITPPTTFPSLQLYPVRQKIAINGIRPPYYALLDTTPSIPVEQTVMPNPIIYGYLKPNLMEITTPFQLYRNTTTSIGRINDNTIGFDTDVTIFLNQLSGWRPPTRLQGFTNYKPTNYINRFLLETNRPLNSELFRLVGPNSKVIDKKFYRIEVNKKVIIINLNANIEVIGYTISTGLYSHISDPTSWKVFGMKDKKWILLDKQDDYDIPVERSYTLPPFYFNSKKNLIKDSIPDIKIIEDYYKKKINPFGKAVFKKYMFDNKKTYYMVFDEYDNNRNLIDTDLIIGFVMAKGVVKKPVMYENSDGSFDAFNLKKKEMMAFWKKKIGLNLETKYLSDY